LRKDAKIFFNSIITAFGVGIPAEALEEVSMGMWWYHNLAGIEDRETEQAVA
ncbi:MAG: hypothetical protein GWN86_21450, partial [Desulfobacterales bacterium]|nr:hypothetical protein [Desulfobacterales bacterium]